MPIEGEIVLIYYQEQPATYARIESIEPDIKKDWYQVTLLFLSIPAQTVTWIIRESYLNGESFTMGGLPVRLEEVKKSLIKRETEGSVKSKGKKGPKKPGKVIPLRKNIKKS